MRRILTLVAITVLMSLTGCASLRGGPPSCDGSARRPVGMSTPDRTSFIAPDVSKAGGSNGQS